jgi:hypothetical protein
VSGNERNDGGGVERRIEEAAGWLTARRGLRIGDWLALRRLSYQQKGENCHGSGPGSAGRLGERYTGFSRVGDADAGEQVEGKACTCSGVSIEEE